MLKLNHHPAMPPTWAAPMDPATLAIVAATVAATGSISAGNAANAQAKAQARVLRQQAVQEEAAARAEERDFRRQQERLMARRRALMGASGIRPDVGSPVDVMRDIAGETELQALRIRHGGALRATRLRQQARLVRAQGRAAQRAGFFRAGSILLSSGSNFGGGGSSSAMAGPDLSLTGPGGTVGGGV